jgi:ThiF family
MVVLMTIAHSQTPTNQLVLLAMSASKQIDENKYSRQIGAYGAETMARVSAFTTRLSQAYQCCLLASRRNQPKLVHAPVLWLQRCLSRLFCGIVVLQLVQLRVLIVGAKGLGIETAKNLVLAGPAAVTLHDEGVATHADLGANFFLRPEHVGTRRAQAVINQLKALNDDVEIKTSREWLRGAGKD